MTDSEQDMPDSEMQILSQELQQYIGQEDAENLAEDLNKYRRWAIDTGKDPDRGEGLAAGTVENYIDRLNQVLVKAVKEGLEPRITHPLATAYMQELNRDKILKRSGEPYSSGNKRKDGNALDNYFDYRAKVHDQENWSPPVRFRDGSTSGYDSIKTEEVKQLTAAAEEYRTIRSYSSVTPEERTRMKSLLAERKNTTPDSVSPDDWENYAKSDKYSSLVRVSHEAGLIPEDVAAAKVSWIRPEDDKLVIPTEEGAKQRPLNAVSLTEEAMSLLENWLRERQCYEKYDDTDHIWLNHQWNPYDSGSLNDLLRNLIDYADIEATNRDLIWYGIRKGMANEIRRKGDVHEAADQLRHSSTESLEDYADTNVEERRDTLEDIYDDAPEEATISIDGNEITLREVVEFLSKFK